MSKNEAVVDILRPADEVFAFMTDLGRWGSWHPGHLEAGQTSDGALRVGATISETFWLVPPIRGRAIYEVTAYEPGRSFEYVTLRSPVQAKVWAHLQPIQAGTRVTLGHETESSRVMRLFQRIFAKLGQQMVEDEAKKLKNMLEMQPAAAPMPKGA